MLFDGDDGKEFVEPMVPWVPWAVVVLVPDVLVFSRPIRGSIDCLDFRGLGTFEGVVVDKAIVPANEPLPDPPPLLLRFIETGPNVVRRGFGGRGMVQ